MTSECVSKSLILLELILKAKTPIIVAEIIKKGGEVLANCLTELAYNLLYGNIGINKREAAALKPYKNIVRKIADKNIPSSRKVRLLMTNAKIVREIVKLAAPVVKVLAQ